MRSATALPCPKCGTARIVPIGSSQAFCLKHQPAEAWLEAERIWKTKTGA